MRKTAAAVTLISALLFSALALTPFVRFGSAQGSMHSSEHI
jgi:hypothetical protein